MKKLKSAKFIKKKKLTKVEFDYGLSEFKAHYPDAHCALNYKNAYELLIATILSAQCTDERVNIVTKNLFKKFPNPGTITKADTSEIEDLIRSVGFYRNKSKSIKKCCEILVTEHSGTVPKTMEALYNLPGVGRKTANVVLGNAYNIASGVVVDTHVSRLANRMGWVKGFDAVKIEQQLNAMCPKEDWIMLSHYLIAHGRTICKARTPLCSECFLQTSCPKVGI